MARRLPSLSPLGWLMVVGILLAFYLMVETNLQLDRALKQMDHLDKVVRVRPMQPQPLNGASSTGTMLQPGQQQRQAEAPPRQQNQQQPAPDDSASRLNCGNVETWEDVKRCRNGRKHEYGYQPQDYYIRLVGERNSGTKFLLSNLQSCFKSLGIPANRDFTRSKHWFQKQPHFVRPSDRGNYYHNDTSRAIIVTVHRDPVDWVAAMIQSPYHMLNHHDGFDAEGNPVPLDWKRFIGRPWTLNEQTALDKEALEKHAISGSICSYDFYFSEVTPCLTDESIVPKGIKYHVHNPVYELKHDGSGEPYQTILELRADKIRHYVDEIYSWKIGGYLAVRYEDLLTDGMGHVFAQLAEILGLPVDVLLKCNIPGPQRDRLHQRKVPQGLRHWVRQNSNIEAETLLGYR